MIVEGPTDALGLPELLQRVDLDFLGFGIQVVSVGGIGNLARWWRLYTSYGLPTYVVFDSDSKDDPDSIRRQGLLKTLNVAYRDYEATVAAGPLGVAENFAVCVSNYETAMRSLFPSQYEALEEEARGDLGGGKPLTARYVARRLNRDEDQAGWDAIMRLAYAIRVSTRRGSWPTSI